MGAVYLCSHNSIDQHIAIKVLHGRAARSDELVQRFYREAKAISRLSHPNIIRVFIFGRTEDGIIYLAMEYIKGVSLRQSFANGPMDEARAIKIMKQVLSGLSEAHTLGIIHRDLKPDNILLTSYRGEEDYVKVLDFGIAKVKEPDGDKEVKLTQAGVVYGTPEYLSPEQAQALELDNRTDLYSLGIILYEMLTGTVPFTAPTAVTVLTMHVFEEPQPPSSTGVSLSPEMDAIVMRAIAKKTEHRFQSADDFFKTLVERERQMKNEGFSEKTRIRVPGAELYATSSNIASSSGSEFSSAPTKEYLRSKESNRESAPATVMVSSINDNELPENKTRKLILTMIIIGLVLLVLLMATAIGLLLKEKFADSSQFERAVPQEMVALAEPETAQRIDTSEWNRFLDNQQDYLY